MRHILSVEVFLRSNHFLQRSRHGVWYFRIRVPKILRTFLGCAEIRRSLQTCEIKQARPEARLLSVYAERLFTTLRRAIATGRPLTLGTMTIPDDIRSFTVEVKTKKAGVSVKVDADSSIPGDVQGAQEALRQLFPQGLPSGLQVGSQTAAPVVTSSRLSEVAKQFTKMAVSEERSRSTVSEYAATIQEFIERIGDLPIREVTGKHISCYTHFLLTERKLKQRTIDKKLNAINALFRQAKNDGDWDKKEEFPTVGHYKFKKKKRRHAQVSEDGYQAFVEAELVTLYTPEQYLKNATVPHEYWLPLLGFFCGGRLNELCQLMVGDVKQHNGVWVIHINKEGHPLKRLKTAASERMVPLHSVLIDLGFLEYVELVRAFDTSVFEFPGLVFPYLSHTEKNAFGGAPSQRFGRFLDRLGITDEKKVFHSFRGNLNQALMNLRVHEEHRCRLMGHDYSSVNSDSYTTDLPLSMVRDDFVEHLPLPPIDFSALKLSMEEFHVMLDRLANMRRKKLAHEAAAFLRNQPAIRVRNRIASL